MSRPARHATTTVTVTVTVGSPAGAAHSHTTPWHEIGYDLDAMAADYRRAVEPGIGAELARLGFPGVHVDWPENATRLTATIPARDGTTSVGLRAALLDAYATVTAPAAAGGPGHLQAAGERHRRTASQVGQVLAAHVNADRLDLPAALNVYEAARELLPSGPGAGPVADLAAHVTIVDQAATRTAGGDDLIVLAGGLRVAGRARGGRRHWRNT